MTQRDSGAPYLDAQVMTDTEASVYEAIATLEYMGRPVTAAQVTDVTGLDSATVGAIVRALAEQGVLVPVTGPGGEQGEYSLARRDWSAAPGTPSQQ
jgi:DNA-binding MarR family transcriptional regulator